MDAKNERCVTIEAVKASDLIKHYMQPLEEFLAMSGVTEVCVNRFDEIYIEKNGRFEKTAVEFENNRQVEKLIEQIAKALDQPVHRDNFPILDARLTSRDGSTMRINAALPPVSVRGASLTIRIFPPKILDAGDLLRRGSLKPDMLEFLKIAVACRRNMVVSGGTGSGKTTLINVLCSFIPQDDRIVTIEDTVELQIGAPHRVSMEAPRRRAEHGKDAQRITMSYLLSNALRQRPDRIIVGEIRSADAASSFLQAINTGHEGCMTTLHANSTCDALSRMEVLLASAERALPYDMVKSQVRGNLHVLIQQQRIPNEGRRIVEIAEVFEHQVRWLWSWDYKNKCYLNKQPYQTSVTLKLADRYGVAHTSFN